ncbi:hypothetical protein CYLTODRAFT_492562 [Cylindrobasidium torrendii FP15055 ss-10]|uniref:Pentacotripeptide-repeat region of PRORP domain-containing protein n=1 Tax=Cylindrobasidium torrendii FP15055 ss-10 TaxID=1314674 RepID=A0A0D7B4M1_9AGAR|nr:hypothetical protein CYLTODRAFT_492562 [Cylindrobasidium torrendii FP15055 ss-10]
MQGAAWRARHSLSHTVALAPSQYPPSFAQALLQAAGRAWTRSASTDSRAIRTTRYDSTRASSSSQNRPLTRRPRSHQGHALSASYTLPEDISDTHYAYDDPGKSKDEDQSPAFASELFQPVHIAIPNLSAKDYLLSCSNPKIFKSNILTLLGDDPGSRSRSLRRAIQYHSELPVRQTDTYNILITAALRAQEVELAGQLFTAMAQEQIPQNERTVTLMLRRLIALGLRDDARAAMERSPGGLQDTPLVHALEFYYDTRTKHNLTGAATVHSAAHFLEILKDTGAKLEPDTPPEVISKVVHSLIILDRFPLALRLATSALSAMPASTTADDGSRWMTVVHIMLQYGPTCTSFAFPSEAKGELKPGPRFFAARRMLQDLLARHSALVPTPKTVGNLLVHLRRVQNRGRLAVDVVQEFEKQWGTGAVDGRVYRQVASLLETQGKRVLAQQWLDASKAVDRGPEDVRSGGDWIGAGISENVNVHRRSQLRDKNMRRDLEKWLRSPERGLKMHLNGYRQMYPRRTTMAKANSRVYARLAERLKEGDDTA